jgi:hypothetical protein
MGCVPTGFPGVSLVDSESGIRFSESRSGKQNQNNGHKMPDRCGIAQPIGPAARYPVTGSENVKLI